jgi:hypothetical protein
MLPIIDGDLGFDFGWTLKVPKDFLWFILFSFLLLLFVIGVWSLATLRSARLAALANLIVFNHSWI